jgi:dihydroorotate dehydrogenase electron transfer subunit
MEQTLGTIDSNEEVMPGVYLMWIQAPGIAAAAQPGQFITLRCDGLTLRRPFSVHQSSPAMGQDSGKGEIALLYRVAGRGTTWLSRRRPGEKMDILGPLGQGFSMPSVSAGQSEHLLLVAGGIGIAPLFFLMQCASSQHMVTLIHGASTAAQLYPGAMPGTGSSSAAKNRNELLPLSEEVRFVPVTEDGSAGKKGMATDILPDFLDWADQVYACGPVDMYKSMAEMSAPLGQNKLKLGKCQVSLEVRMGCGFGACYGCTISTHKGLKQVCRDGPVFELNEIIWQEVRI